MWPWYTADDKRSAAAIIALIATMIITAEAADAGGRRDGRPSCSPAAD